MLEKTKRKAIKKYFVKFPYWIFFSSLMGLLSFTLFFVFGNFLLIIFSLLLVSVGCLRYYFHASKISDQQFDNFRDELLTLSHNKMNEKYGILESDLKGVPSTVYFYAPGETDSALTAKSIKGKDGEIRYNPVRFIVIGFGNEQLFAYQGVVELFSGNIFNESSEEFFYNDVNSVATKTMPCKFNWKGEVFSINDTETFILNTKQGTDITIPLKSEQLSILLGGGRIPNTSAYQALAAIRAKVREKKQSKSSTSESTNLT